MAGYIGMNFNLDCVCYDAWDETTIMAFKDDVIQFFTNEVLTSTASRLAMFPQIGTTTIYSVHRTSPAGTNPNVFWQLYFYDVAGNYWRYETTSLNPTGYTFLSSGTHGWMVNQGPRGEGWQLWFYDDNGVAKVDAVGNTGNYQPYGPGTTLYPTLPNTQVPDACWHNSASGVVYVSIIDTIYLLSTATSTVTSFAKYNQPLIPPTPLPDHIVTYSAPSQFNLFSNNVALVTETPLGWNFTKSSFTSADKMELYLYHSSAPGAMPFNYNDLLDIKISMMNNLVLPVGEIFFTIWTGPPVAPNWYNYKDIFNMTPPLGTTIDTALVETILTLSDIRTDPILAIAVHSNSAQQQVNCDVHKVSFNILLPATNESQRVEVQLQNNFIVVDDKYWDLENNAVAKLNGVILPEFEISDFTPNIIAGNYPQSGTAKEPPSGAAWYLAGTYTEWIQNVANTWVPSGNTIVFTSSTVDPGIDTNGAAWIGSIGGVAITGTWSPIPYIWQITAGNQFTITHTNGQPVSFRPLAELPQPNNFTPAQYESGMYSVSNVGTMTTSVLISNSVASFKSPIFPVGIDLTFLSETQVIIRRSWEIINTTYTLTSSNVLSGTYVSPTYPNANTPTLPDSYTTPTAWVVLANNDSQFNIEFSGGLNNTITADGAYNMAVNPVGPSPITYAWTANYYTSTDVLISPVVGFGTTGSVSNFTIALASVPAAAEYILYVCTSSENVEAYASLVIIQAAAAIPFVLDFQNQSAQIVVDATYSVTPNPIDNGVTYAYTADYKNEFDASLGNVIGFSQTTPSTFNFVYANIPTGAKYIDYGCSATGGNQGGETARISISIIPQIPPAPQTFELEFNGGVYPVNITADGTYNMIPFPTESALIITYTYTANYFVGTTDLGAVVGFDVTGQSSSFPFSFATMPATATYIKYVCSASGTGLQNGETAESIIGLVEPCPICPDSDNVELVRATTGNIEFNQINADESLKLLSTKNLGELKMSLVDSYGSLLHTDTPIYYECQLEAVNKGGSVLTDS
jgi:hypothetical protein